LCWDQHYSLAILFSLQLALLLLLLLLGLGFAGFFNGCLCWR
jgi:hypothetical protein